MARLAKLSSEEALQVLADAASKSSPLTVTVQRQNRWLAFRSRLIVIHKNNIWTELPSAGAGGAAFDYVADEEIGLMFQAGSTRYFFGATALGQEAYSDDSGQNRQAIRMKFSGTMQCCQRRLHEREEPPAGWHARASFWLGGRQAEPDGARVDLPVWSGRVMDLSLGGLLVRVSGEAAGYIEVSDIVGIRLSLGDEDENVFLDAQLRHHDAEGEMVLMGFQFVDLETDYAQEAIAAIAHKLPDQQI